MIPAFLFLGTLGLQGRAEAGSPQGAASEPPTRDLPSLLSSREGLSDPRELAGVIAARHSVELTAEIEARLEEMKVQLGDRVSLGEVVATLDAWKVRHDLQISEALLRSAKAKAGAAALDHQEARERTSRRAAVPDAWSQEEMAGARLQEERAALQVAGAEADVARQQAEVDRLLRTLEAAQLKAPFDAAVAEIYQDPGSLLQPGTPIVRLISADELRVRFAVPEAQCSELRVGLVVRVTLPATGAQLLGSVSHVAPDLDPSTQMLTVEAPLVVPDSLLDRVRSGMLARVLLTRASPP